MKFNINEQLKNNKEIITKFGYILLRIFVYLLIFILLILIFINEKNSLKAFNYTAVIIVSESMEPEINVGDIIIIKNSLQNDIKENHIITFEKDNEYITHRVVRIEEQNNEKLYITKGDNNKVNDVEKIRFSEIKGIKIAQIPYIGLLILKVSRQKNILIILIVLVLLYIRALKVDNKKKERIKKKRIEDEKNFKD